MKTVTARKQPNFGHQADSVVIPLEVEHALSYHLGKRSTHGLVGERSLQSWVRISRRLVRSLEKYIEVNVDSDSVHHERLQAQLKKMKRHSVLIVVANESRSFSWRSSIPVYCY